MISAPLSFSNPRFQGIDWMRVGNALGLLGIIFVLGFALADQFLFHDLPCPLCLLQRLGFILSGMCFMANLRWGASPLVYGLLILSVLFTNAAAVRQILLHITPDDAGYGNQFLGLHFYTWALVASLGILLYASLLLCIHQTRVSSFEPHPKWVSALCLAFMGIILVCLISTTLQCGLGPCDPDPTHYQLAFWASHYPHIP